MSESLISKRKIDLMRLQIVQQNVQQPTQQMVQPPARLQTRTANDYKSMSQRDHIYKIADTYIGSDQQNPREALVLDIETMTARGATITLPSGVERLYLEILSNAADNVDCSHKVGVDPGQIEIMMNRSTVSIKNGGVPIPIDINQETGLWAPEMIFGRLLTSSNYDTTVDRTGNGRNGYGAKLVNIFSHSFMVEVADPYRGRHYRQVWGQNMTQRGEPEITEYPTTAEAYVRITYMMDFTRFGYPEPNEESGGYPEEAFALFARHAADQAMTCKVPITFNGHELKTQSIEKYGEMLFGKEKMARSIVYYEWPQGTEVTTRRNGLVVAQHPGVIPIIELCVIDTPDAGCCISFVNGIPTFDGGVHVNAAMKAVTAGILETINGDRSNDRSGKGKKGKDTKAPVTLTLTDVKPHISVILSCRLINPKFNSQTKNMLSSPTPKINIPEAILKPVNKWDLLHRLYAALDAKQFKTLTKTDGKKRRHIGVLRGEDANNAGTKNSESCTLVLVEGRSAMGYAAKMVSLVPGGRNSIGIMPLKGKPLNVMNANFEQIHKNAEIEELKNMLGLREGVDYTIDENFRTLRYGYLLIMADSDDDGKHIVGLLLLMFFCRFPSLLARGFVMYLRTPILRVYRGNQVMKFYTHSEYLRWAEQTPDHKAWKHKYFKGLGTSTDKDIKDDFKAPRVVNCFFDDRTPEALRLAFDDKRANDRKRWIAEWQPAIGFEDLQMQPISAFIENEVLEYSRANVKRSIPRDDGLKESQRKALWGAIMKWGTKDGAGYIKRGPEEIKVAQLAAYVAEKTKYHHGEKCLSDTIVMMAQDFVGANNLPFFTQDGQFGTRNMGGNDAAETRYSFTRPQWWINYVFRKEDRPLLEMEIEDGDPTQPKNMLPIIPMALVNGAHGISSGWSTFVPSCNPLTVAEWYLAKLQGQPLPDVKPWYRGFTGTIEVVERQPQVRRPRNADLKPLTGIRLNIQPNLAHDHGVNRGLLENHTPEVQLKPVETNLEEDPATEDLDNEEELDHRSEEDGEDEGPRHNYDRVRSGRISMVTRGAFHLENGEVVVTEIPVGRWIADYRKWLAGLSERKEIVDFNDYSTHDRPNFRVMGFRGPNDKSLKLIKSYGLTNMVLLDDEGHPIKYPTILSMLESFYNKRLPFYEARRQHIINEYQHKIDTLNIKARFIMAVVNEEILLVGKHKRDLIPQMRSMGFPEELLTSVRASNFTADEVQELLREVEQLTNERNRFIEMSPAQLWITDLNDFLDAYRRNYPKDPTVKEQKVALKMIPSQEVSPVTPTTISPPLLKLAVHPEAVPVTTQPAVAPTRLSLRIQ